MREYLQMDILPEYCFSFFATSQPNMSLYVKSVDHDVLSVCLEGMLRFCVDKEEETLSTGEWYIHQAASAPPIVIHNADAQIYSIFFRGRFGQSRHNALPTRGHFPLHSVLPLVEHLDELTKYPQTPPFLLVSDFFSLCALLMQTSSPAPHRHSNMNDVQAYLRIHFTEKIDMTRLARQYGYSPDHLARKYQHAFGITPAAHLRSLRIHQALRLLNRPGANLQSVSEACGYSDYSTFYRAFVAHTGVSPNQWMEQIRK